MIEINGLHLLLTYQCTLECDHCFVWSSPWATGTMTLGNVRDILQQAQDVGTINSIYFEGGEPFLCYPVLVKGVQEAVAKGFKVGIVSNSFWATDIETALEWLKPFAGLLNDISFSNDVYHWDEHYSALVNNAVSAAQQLNLPVGTITIAEPETSNAAAAVGQLPPAVSKVMYRGRAAVNLADRAVKYPAQNFTTCPYENLRDPGRIHVDPLGYLHLCQGISMGNMFETPLKQILATFEPDSHPIVGPLLNGGPSGLAANHHMANGEQGYADACQLCYETRFKLRSQYPTILTPDQMYGIEA